MDKVPHYFLRESLYIERGALPLRYQTARTIHSLDAHELFVYRKFVQDVIPSLLEFTALSTERINFPLPFLKSLFSIARFSKYLSFWKKSNSKFIRQTLKWCV